jgi:hypothetical protein
MFAAFLVAGLAACDAINDEVPHILTDEIPPEVRTEARPVPTAPPPPEHRDWPLAASVPQGPRDFTPAASIDAAKTEMQNQRNEDTILRQNYDDAPPVVPMAPQ